MEVHDSHLYYMVRYFDCLLPRYLGFAGVVLYPLDIVYSMDVPEVSEDFVSIWTILYWVTFFLSWVIIPLIQDYWASGEFGKWYCVLQKDLHLLGIDSRRHCG